MFVLVVNSAEKGVFKRHPAAGELKEAGAVLKWEFQGRMRRQYLGIKETQKAVLGCQEKGKQHGGGK